MAAAQQTYGWDHGEAYACAANAPSFSGHSGGSLATLGAAAKASTQSQLGASLSRLRGEYDAAGFHPRPAKFENAAAERAFEAGQLAAFNRLRSLPVVRAELERVAMSLGIHNCNAKVAAVLIWWLHPSCDHCCGTGSIAMHHPRLGEVEADCPFCKATGQTPPPPGQDSKAILAAITFAAKSFANSMDRSTADDRPEIPDFLRRIRRAIDQAEQAAPQPSLF